MALTNPEFQKQLNAKLKHMPTVPPTAGDEGNDKRKSKPKKEKTEKEKKDKLLLKNLTIGSAGESGTPRSGRKPKKDKKMFSSSNPSLPTVSSNEALGVPSGGTMTSSVGSVPTESSTSDLTLTETIDSPVMAEYSPALLDAVRVGDIEEVKRLLETNIDVNSLEQSTNNTPLHLAFQGGPYNEHTPNYELAAVLLSHKATDLTIRDSEGYPSLHILLFGYYDLNLTEELFDKIEIEGGRSFPSNLTDVDGSTLLMVALNGHSSTDIGTTYYMCEYLLKHGVSVNKQNDSKDAPLHVAIKGRMGSIVDLLIEHSVDEHVTNQEGQNALELCQSLGFDDMEAKIAGIADRKRAMQIENVFKEIVATEDAYCRYLKTMIDVFMEPFLHEHHVSAKVVNSMFWNVTDLLRGNLLFFDDLKVLEGYPEESRDIGAVFLTHLPAIRAHIEYCENTGLAERVLLIVKNNAFLTNWLTKQQRKPECEKQDLESFLIKPLQRVCKYPLLLRELLRSTPDSHPQFPSLEEASNRVSEVVSEANEKKRFRDDELKAIDYFEKDFTFTNSSKLMTTMALKLAEKDKLIPHHFFLFTNALVFAIKKKDTYEAKHVIAMESSPVVWNEQKKAKHQYDHSFVLARRDKQSKLTVVFDDDTKKQQVMSLLGDQLSLAMVGLLDRDQDGPLSRLAKIDELWEEGFGDPSLESYEAGLAEPRDERSQLFHDYIVHERNLRLSLFRLRDVVFPELKKALEPAYNSEGLLQLTLLLSHFPAIVSNGSGYAEFAGNLPFLEYLFCLASAKEEKFQSYLSTHSSEESIIDKLKKVQESITLFVSTVTSIAENHCTDPADQSTIKKLQHWVVTLQNDWSEKEKIGRNFVKLLEIQDLIEGSDKIPIASKDEEKRELLKRGDVGEVEKGGKERGGRVFFVFNDLLVLASHKASGSNYKLVTSIRGQDVQFSDYISDSPSVFAIEFHSAKLKKEKNPKFTILFRSVEEKEEWHAVLRPVFKQNDAIPGGAEDSLNRRSRRVDKKVGSVNKKTMGNLLQKSSDQDSLESLSLSGSPNPSSRPPVTSLFQSPDQPASFDKSALGVTQQGTSYNLTSTGGLRHTVALGDLHNFQKSLPSERPTAPLPNQGRPAHPLSRGSPNTQNRKPPPPPPKRRGDGEGGTPKSGLLSVPTQASRSPSPSSQFSLPDSACTSTTNSNSSLSLDNTSSPVQFHPRNPNRASLPPVPSSRVSSILIEGGGSPGYMAGRPLPAPTRVSSGASIGATGSRGGGGAAAAGPRGGGGRATGARGRPLPTPGNLNRAPSHGSFTTGSTPPPVGGGSSPSLSLGDGDKPVSNVPPPAPPRSGRSSRIGMPTPQE